MQLHQELLTLRKKEQHIHHEIIAKLQLMEEGRKYLYLGYSSLFDYLVRGLSYSESAAYRKQSCVRLSQEIPEVKEKIQSGALTTAGLSMAFKSLKGKSTHEKKRLLKKIEHQPTREIKKILIQEEVAPEIRVQKIEYKDKVILKLELSHKQHQKLEHLKALKSHKGGMEQLLEDLIDGQLRAYENKSDNKRASKSRFYKNRTDEKKVDSNKVCKSKTNKNSVCESRADKSEAYESISHNVSRSKNPRFVSQRLRNELLKKAHFQCQYPGCEETHFLQIDHKVPVRGGGRASPDNLQVLCGAHNRMKG